MFGSSSAQGRWVCAALGEINRDATGKKKQREDDSTAATTSHGVHGEGRDYSASVSRKDLWFLPPLPPPKKSAPSGYCLHYCAALWNKCLSWLHSNATVTTSVLASASSRCPEAGPHQAPGFHINIGAGSGDNNPTVFMNTSVFTVEVWRPSRAESSGELEVIKRKHKHRRRSAGRRNDSPGRSGTAEPPSCSENTASLWFCY